MEEEIEALRSQVEALKTENKRLNDLVQPLTEMVSVINPGSLSAFANLTEGPRAYSNWFGRLAALLWHKPVTMCYILLRFTFINCYNIRPTNQGGSAAVASSAGRRVGVKRGGCGGRGCCGDGER